MSEKTLVCRGCGGEYPRTTEYFPPKRRKCHACCKVDAKQYDLTYRRKIGQRPRSEYLAEIEAQNAAKFRQVGGQAERICSQCGQWHSYPDGFVRGTPHCKACRRKASQKRLAVLRQSPEMIARRLERERQREQRRLEKQHALEKREAARLAREQATHRVCTICAQEYPLTREFFYYRKRGGFGSRCIACELKLKAWQRGLNPDEYVPLRERGRVDPEVAEREYRRIARLRRRARERSLPRDFTTADWRYALDYFDHCCAVCGAQLNGLFTRPAADHWIPLSKGGGTVATNMVPLCHGDAASCNIEKADQMPLDWLVAKYGRKRACEVMSRIEAYFRTISVSED